MIEIIIRGDKPEEVERLIVFCSGVDQETTADCIDDLAGDLNTLRGDVRKLEVTQVDPQKMFNDTYEKVKKILGDKNGRINKKTEK